MCFDPPGMAGFFWVALRHGFAAWRVTDMWRARYGFWIWMPKLRVMELGISAGSGGFRRGVFCCRYCASVPGGLELHPSFLLPPGFETKIAPRSSDPPIVSVPPMTLRGAFFASVACVTDLQVPTSRICGVHVTDIGWRRSPAIAFWNVRDLLATKPGPI